MKYLSAMVTIARGSIGGITFTANQHHQLIARAKTAPVNPKTVNQEMMRVAFGAASVLWKGLTDAQRDDWADYSKTVDYPGPLGDYNATGRGIFMANLSMIQYINSRALDVLIQSVLPPTTPGVPSWSNVHTAAPTVPGDGFSIHMDNIDLDDMNYFITISPPQHPSRLRWKGPWKSDTAVSDTVASLASGSEDFLGLEVGSAYFVRIKGITVAAPHRSSFEVILRHIAETTVV